jgi:hypothetical protein
MPRSLISRRRRIVPRSVDLHFSHISTPNFKCRSTWKLCPSTKHTTFTLEDCEVFRENSKNAAKVPADTGGSKRVQGVWLGFWPNLDHGWPKGSLGIVGDVFEVMAQVDRRLTKVNTVDLLIRVNNSGWKPGASQLPSLKRQHLPYKRVGHVSFPTKSKSGGWI